MTQLWEKDGRKENMVTEIILLLVILLQFGYIIYKDVAERKERENLQLKLMSKNVAEYIQAVEPEPKVAKSEPNPYKNLEDIDIDKLLAAKDKI